MPTHLEIEHYGRAGERRNPRVTEPGIAVHERAIHGGLSSRIEVPAIERRHGLYPVLPQDIDEKTAVKNYNKAIGKGLLKVMSKMGISTYMLIIVSRLRKKGGGNSG